MKIIGKSIAMFLAALMLLSISITVAAEPGAHNESASPRNSSTNYAWDMHELVLTPEPRKGAFIKPIYSIAADTYPLNGPQGNF